MDRTSMMAAVQAAMPGLSQSTLDAMSDDALADLVKNIPTASPVPDPSAIAPVAPSGMMADLPREELVAALTDAGEDPAELEGMSDDELQAMLDEIEGGGEGGPEAEGEVETMGDPATMSREELITELVASGQDAAALEALPDEELRAMHTQVVGGATATAPAAAAPVVPMGESVRNRTRPRQAQRQNFAERESKRLVRNLKRLNTFAERENRRLVAASAEAKRRDVAAFCEQLVREGRATPAQVQVVYKPLLLAMDNTHSVHKFTDGKVTRRVTAYELKKQELLALAPVVKFGERFGKDGQVGVDGDREVRIVERFAEANNEHLKRGGTSGARLVADFKKMREKNPEITAAKLIGEEAARYS